MRTRVISTNWRETRADFDEGCGLIGRGEEGDVSARERERKKRRDEGNRLKKKRAHRFFFVFSFFIFAPLQAFCLPFPVLETMLHARTTMVDRLVG